MIIEKGTSVMRISTPIKIALALISTGILFSACQSGSTQAVQTTPNSATQNAAQPSANAVTIQNMAFSPQNIQVKVGQSITWTNRDTVSHTVTSDTGAFDSGSVANNTSFSHTFTTAGVFAYHCSIHPSMTAQVTVTQ